MLCAHAGASVVAHRLRHIDNGACPVRSRLRPWDGDLTPLFLAAQAHADRCIEVLLVAQGCQVLLLSLECASCDAPNELFLEYVVNDQRNDGCNRKAGHLKAPLDIVLPIQEHYA